MKRLTFDRMSYVLTSSVSNHPFDDKPPSSGGAVRADAESCRRRGRQVDTERNGRSGGPEYDGTGPRADSLG